MQTKDIQRGGANNLIPLNKRSKEEVQAITRKGGLASGETKRKQKSIKTILNFIDRQKLPRNQALTFEAIFAVKDPTLREAILMTVYKQALEGNMRAIELYLKLKGEMPNDIALQANDKSLTIIWNEQKYETD